MKTILSFLLSVIAITTNAQDYKIENNEVKISKPILFESGTDQLKSASDEALAIIKKYLDEKTYISLLRIESHSDNSGNAEESQRLTEKRSMAVCKALVKTGVDCNRLIATGFGANKPIADNGTAEGKAENRRISFVNVSLKGRVISGLPIDGGGKVAGKSCPD